MLVTLDITSNISPQTFIAIVLIATLGEAYFQVPLLLESIWLVIGYQSTASPAAMLNALTIFIIVQACRQAAIFTIYHVISAFNTPLSRWLITLLQKNRYFRRYKAREQFYNARFGLTLPAVALGMMTWLNGPIKLGLILSGRLRILLLGTLLSGMTFDTLYLTLGAVFRTTQLHLAFLPVLLLVGFLVFILVRAMALKRVRGQDDIQ